MPNTGWRRRHRSFRIGTLLMIGLVVALTTLIFLPRINAEEFPREGVTGIPNGVPELFAGLWSVGFPERNNGISPSTITDCAAPVELSGTMSGMLTYLSPTGDRVEFQVAEFAGRTTWFPEKGESLVAVWINNDEFYLYSVDQVSGRAGWDSPHAYRRCR